MYDKGEEVQCYLRAFIEGAQPNWGVSKGYLEEVMY